MTNTKEIKMTNPHPDENAKCPYCGSKDFSVCTFGYANWECDRCNNTFKIPYIPKEEAPLYKAYKPYQPTIRDHIGDFIITKLPFITIILIAILMAILVIAGIIRTLFPGGIL